MFQKLRRFGGAALLTAAIAAPGFAQEQNREKFIIAGSSNKVERSGAVASTPTGRKIAIVIAVSDLEKKELAGDQLSYVENDARRMIETLFNDGFEVWPLCEADVRLPKAKQGEQRKLARLQKRLKEPTKANIEATVAEALDGVDKNDVVFVYFSGHGLLEDGDATYLVAKDADNASHEAVKRTCVAVSDLRGALADSASRYCLLSLDCCHAGGTRSVASFDEFEHYIEYDGPAGVTTLASCSAEQSSDGWTPIVEDPNDVAEDGAVSIFTYWLNAGLKGFADGAFDGEADGKIASDELFAYVDANAAFHRKDQTSYVIAKRDAKPFVLCDVKPMKYDEAMASVAKQIVTKAKFIGGNEIVLNVKTVGDEVWDGDAKAVDGLNSFAVGAQNYLQKSVDAFMEKVGDLGGKGTRGSVDVDATVELVERDLVDENGEAETVREYVLTCRFDSAQAKGRADEVKAHILPKNAGETFANDVRPAESLSIANPSAAPSAPPVANPVEEPTVSFTAPEITVEATLDGGATWQKRPIYRGADGANWVELNPGETYRVVAQPSNEPGNPESVGLRLLIDGRNTLPQAELQLYAGTRSAVPQPVARLDSARWWSLRLAEGGVYDAFYRLEKDENGDYFSAAGNAFQVASTASVGASTGQNGMIDVAFYALRPTDGTRSASDVLTEEGGETFKVFEARSGMEIDYQLACFRLRYASASRLAELGVDESGLSGATVATAEPTASLDVYAGTRGADKSKELKTGKKRNDDKRETTSNGVLR